MVSGSITKEFPLIGGSNQQKIAIFDSQRSLNLYEYSDPVTGENVLYPYCGSNKVLDFPVGMNDYKGRPGGTARTDTLAFFVIGPLVFKVDLSFTVDLIGTISTSSGPVKMEVGGEYLSIVEGSAAWTYNITTGVFVQTTDSDAPVSPSYVCEQQGFFLFNDQQTQTDYQSAQYDPTKFDALNTIQINYRSSIYSFPLIAQQSINGRIFCFTSGFTQVLENQGKAGFTFRPDENLIFGYGVVNAPCVAKGIGGAYGNQQPEFLVFICDIDGAKKVMMTYGQAPEVISTPSIEYRLNQLENIGDAVGFVFNENGNTFYQVSFTTDNITLCCNLTNRTWFDVDSKGNRHFAEAFVYFAGKRLVTSYEDNGLYEMSEDFETNSGHQVTRERISENFRITNYNQFSVDMFNLYCQQGIGLIGRYRPDIAHYKYGSTAEFEMYTSQDGGQTWDEPQIRSFGVAGRTTHVSRFTNLGVFRDFCVKIVIKQPLKNVCFLGAMITITPMEGTQ